MQFRLLLVSALVFNALFSVAQSIPGTASDRNGVLMFIECRPAIQYRHLGQVQCAALAPDKFDLVIDHMIVKQARKTYPEFDALIFRPGSGVCKADVIQFYRDPKAKKKKPKKGEPVSINPEWQKSMNDGKNGIYLFVENNPTVEFTLLGKLELPTTFRSTDIEARMAEMMRIAKSTYPDHNGIVFTSGSDLRKANIIRFNP